VNGGSIMPYRQFAYYYDRLMEDVPYFKWVEFVQLYWEQTGFKPQNIVDLGCGTGNITIPLARQGYKMIGIDLSADMLSVAQHKQNLPIHWLHQDMTEWELPYKVDAVISFCDCLNYLVEKEQVKQMFHRVYEGLQTRGSFIFDVHTLFQLEEYEQEQPFTWNESDLAYIWNCSLDAERSEMEHVLTMFVQDIKESNSNCYQKIEEIHYQRAYSLYWLKVSLEETGFQKIEIYSDFTMNPPTERTKRAFFTAIK